MATFSAIYPKPNPSPKPNSIPNPKTHHNPIIGIPK